MKVKVGNKYYCIKDCITSDDNSLLYKNGKFYTISDISTTFSKECVNFYPVEDNLYDYTGKYFIIDSSVNNIVDGFEWCFLDEYFISEKKLRKLKLERINSVK